MAPVDLLLTGPSNAGLADPGMWTAISLAQATTALLTSRGDFRALRTATALQRLLGEVEAAFMSAHSQLEQDEAHERTAGRGDDEMLPAISG
ncbi:MAG: hypothetical protein JWR63_1991 [Conexibacter sp.]|nr:hypothetical protein [Conexibacter sp.]